MFTAGREGIFAKGTATRPSPIEQVAEAVMYLLNPFSVLLTDIWRKRSDLGIDLDQLDRSASHILYQLSKPTVRAEFASIDLRAEPNVTPPIRWWEYFAKSASEARALLNQDAAKYSGYLDPDTIVAIGQVRADELVYFRLPGLGELESSNRHIVPLPLSYAFGMREGYGSIGLSF
ncbi:MAG: hypothetical protein HZA01_13070 [Nitrospinae bacterium]|nr:hypothetical protein [Nitrospinota bacterium]